MRALLLKLTLAFTLAPALSALPVSALAADSGTNTWPARAIHLIVPFPPGSSPDLIARLLNDKLAQALGHPVIVENKPGAGGNIGTGLVAKAAYVRERQDLLAKLGERTAVVLAAHGVRDGAARWTDDAGWTYRTARLSGTADAATRASISADLARQPGIARVIWEPR